MRTIPLRTLGAALAAPALIAALACGPGEDADDAPESGAFQEQESEESAAPRQGDRTPGVSDRESSDRAARRTAERTTIPRGSVLTLRLDESVSTETHDRGDHFTAEVTQTVRSEDGTVLVPEGAEMRGVVEESQRSAGPEDQAILALRLESLEVEGRRYPVRATVQQARPEQTEGDTGAETAAKIAIGTAAGALVGQVLGGETETTLGGAAAGAAAGALVALSSRRGDATLPEGSRLRIELVEPVRLEGGS